MSLDASKNRLRTVTNGGIGISSFELSGSFVIMLAKCVSISERTICNLELIFSVESLNTGTYSTDRHTAIMHIMWPTVGPEAATEHRKLYYSSFKLQLIILHYTFVAFSTKARLIN
jgi:hypothetical protein